MARESLIGKKFGLLTVIEKTPERAGNCIIYKCKCDCGNECNVVSRYLTRGSTRSCGCLVNKQDITGQKFGFLTVLGKDEEKTRLDKIRTKKYSTFWYCQCDCGSDVISVKKNSLLSGHTSSCGCGGSILPNERFGKLTTIKPTKERTQNGDIIWECQCDCGSIVKTSSHSLKTGKKKCYQCNQSAGEIAIEEWLNNNNICFSKQVTFDNLLGLSGGYLSYDFQCGKLLIEFNGKQHFEYIPFFHRKGFSDFKKQQEHDRMKREYAKQNNYDLLEIPYWDIDKIDNTLNKYFNDKE